MIYEIPLSTEEIQEQSFSLFNMNLRFTLHFNSISSGWQFDLLDTNTDQYIAQMYGLAVNSPALITKNLPFVIVMSDGSGFGLNSIRRSELGTRLKVYFIDKELWHEAIRTTT
ncbi:phage baseplate plug family protein [Photorhabdus sp. SF281]|uniref:phage baseplate plug family protein n=1 Tax=Photorhabdus sp. SF281 TaxID=3459527 RepID=UPI004043C2CA